MLEKYPSYRILKNTNSIEMNRMKSEIFTFFPLNMQFYFMPFCFTLFIILNSIYNISDLLLQ